MLATSDDDGRTWSKPRVVLDSHSKDLPRERSILVGNLWTDPLGKLWLIFDQSMDMFDGRAGVWASVCENPDADAPGVLLKLGKAVPGGAGPDGDIVGFATLCPHKGFPLSYSAADSTFNCPGHYSRFDAEAGGLQVWGQSTQNLPQYTLRVDDKGDIYAEGVDELLYGRLSNVL